ncbi:ribosomal RNA small subunit methyltransferase H [Verrucomicrobia bacterium SCGC AG-212-E04]|nr:ribosomal RNA small subunit methyltransferase H [Verrucomicrobia bacterium SCGC AG-212-E04]OAI42755.1 ribosomal RNA small subunit methyltransferase H [Verrucomicrobia bacterium SCGC AG-212-E04]
MPFYHAPVLRDEVLELLAPGPDKMILDGTLGGGGHAEAILKTGAQLVGLDQDATALGQCRQRFAHFSPAPMLVSANFAALGTVLDEAGIHRVDGILLDLGVSSRQLEDGERGFSFMRDGPLDMRMDARNPMTAAELVNGASSEELTRIFRSYGEEPAAHRVATAIVRQRALQRIERTVELAAIIEGVIPRRGPRHPATRIFQALRMAVNAELASLQTALEASITHLRPGGRLAVITFHSLEDRIVKRFFKETTTANIDRPEWPAPRPNPRHFFTLITKPSLAPSESEMSVNPRARSARLRVAERR